MNSVMENILTRRSCRAFTEEPIPKNLLEDILKAATYAPSGMNRQTWEFVAVTNPDKIKELVEAIATVLGREQYDMYRPAAVILTTNSKDSRFSKEDNACAMENIFLAAHSYGIGSVWINQLLGICDDPVIRKVLTNLGVREDYDVFGTAALGYPAAELPRDVQKTGVIKIVE